MKTRLFAFSVITTVLLLTASGVKTQEMSQTQTPTPRLLSTPQLIRDEKAIVMVYVPTGSFRRGQTVQEYSRLCELLRPSLEKGGSGVCWSSEEFVLTPRVVTVQPFYLDQYEVSRGEYMKCIQADVCSKLDDSRLPSSEPDNVPVRWVSYYDATVYCAWRGARLPTEEEWEYAARGPQGLTFPWGNEFAPDRANFCDSKCQENFYPDRGWNDGYADLAPITAYENGRSWVGAYNLAGNVAEWTSTIDGSEAATRVYKGGYFGGYAHHLASWVRFWTQATFREEIVGFRCARATNQQQATSIPTAIR